MQETINSLIAALPEGRYFAKNPDGTPRCLTITGKMALAALREHHVASAKCATILGLKMDGMAFDEFASRPVLNAGAEANERAMRRAELVRNGKSFIEAAFKTRAGGH